MHIASANVVPRLLLLGGTAEGRALAAGLLASGFDVIASVTTEAAARRLFGGVHPRLTARAGTFDPVGLERFLRARRIGLVLDATHPFAVEITRTAQAVCGRLALPYVRYERPPWEPEGIAYAADFEDAARRVPLLGRRPLLTVGAKPLRIFAPLARRLALYARILPSRASIRQAHAAGFAPERIVAAAPPFTCEQTAELLRRYRIDLLVTKSSGREGGVIEKITAARAGGLPVLMVRRPAAGGGPAAASVAEAIEQCRQSMGMAGP